jgi:hypothetical protein
MQSRVSTSIEMAHSVVSAASMTAVANSSGSGTATTQSGLRSDLVSAPSPHSAQAAFAAMDASTAGDGATWVRAGARHAEAGWQDPALGWVSVRAEASHGGIHAELVGGSTAAAQSLSGHLAGLNTYLQERQTPVQSLHVAQQGEGSVSERGGGGPEQGRQGQNASADRDSPADAPRIDRVQTRAASSPALTEVPGASRSEGGVGTPWSAGRHLSVIA